MADVSDAELHNDTASSAALLRALLYITCAVDSFSAALSNCQEVQLWYLPSVCRALDFQLAPDTRRQMDCSLSWTAAIARAGVQCVDIGCDGRRAQRRCFCRRDAGE